jgi:hypothetical protein
MTSTFFKMLNQIFYVVDFFLLILEATETYVSYTSNSFMNHTAKTANFLCLQKEWNRVRGKCVWEDNHTGKIYRCNDCKKNLQCSMSASCNTYSHRSISMSQLILLIEILCYYIHDQHLLSPYFLFPWKKFVQKEVFNLFFIFW